MKLTIDLGIVILLSVVIVIYSTDISKSYPEKLVVLMKENYIALLLLGILYYTLYLKKYTIGILLSIIILFLMLNIPILTETFLDELGDFPVKEKQAELLKNIEDLDNSKLADAFDGGVNFEKLKGDMKHIDELLDEIEEP